MFLLFTSIKKKCSSSLMALSLRFVFTNKCLQRLDLIQLNCIHLQVCLFAWRFLCFAALKSHTKLWANCQIFSKLKKIFSTLRVQLMTSASISTTKTTTQQPTNTTTTINKQKRMKKMVFAQNPFLCVEKVLI